MSVVISIVYMIIPLVLIGVGIGGAVLTLMSDMTALSDPMTAIEVFSGALITGGPLIIIGALLGLIAALMLPMALMKWLKAGSLTAAFNISDVAKNVLTADYIITLIVAIIYGMVVTAVAGILIALTTITIIRPIIIMGLVSFIMSVSVYSMIAETVK